MSTLTIAISNVGIIYQRRALWQLGETPSTPSQKAHVTFKSICTNEFLNHRIHPQPREAKPLRYTPILFTCSMYSQTRSIDISPVSPGLCAPAKKYNIEKKRTLPRSPFGKSRSQIVFLVSNPERFFSRWIWWGTLEQNVARCNGLLYAGAAE